MTRRPRLHPAFTLLVFAIVFLPASVPAQVSLDEALYELERRSAGASLRLEGEELTEALLSTLASMSTEELESVVWEERWGRELPQIRNATDVDVGDLASAVCLVVANESLTDVGTGYRLETELRDISYIGGFTDPQRVAVGYKGTGFLMGKAWVATAGHVIDCGVKDVSFVFGYLEAGEGGDPVFPYDAVARGDCYIGWQEDLRGGDWALIQLDSAPNESFRRIQDVDTASPEILDEVFLLGHPAGLPLQYTAESYVWDSGDVSPPYFRSSLRTYSGNSGSPIFRDKVAVGIHNGGTYETGPLHSELENLIEIKPYTIVTSTVSAVAYRVGEGEWQVLPRGDRRVVLAVRPGQAIQIMNRVPGGGPPRPMRLPEGKRFRLVERDGAGEDAMEPTGIFEIQQIHEGDQDGDDSQ